MAPLSEATKAKISAAAIERFRRGLAERVAEPTHKRCARCEEVKSVEGFSSRKRKRKSGIVAVAPAGYCKPCEAERVAAWKQRKIKEGTWHKYRERNERNRDKAKLRQYQREWHAAKRREEGRAVRAKGSTPAVNHWLPAAPLVTFLRRAEEIYDQGQIAELTGVAQRRLYAILKAEVQLVRLSTVDQLLTGLSCPEVFHDLYPAEERPAGYFYLDPEGNPVNGPGQ